MKILTNLLAANNLSCYIFSFRTLSLFRNF